MPRKPAKKTPATWKPLKLYAHQEQVKLQYMEGIRRFFLGWHRRAGKDVFALDFCRERMYERIGSYWHLFPFQIQAKRAIWKGIDARTGERFIDRAFPPSIRTNENDTECSFEIDCGSTWQMLGSDNYDRMVGSNPCGIIFSEWALCDPAAWDYIRPILVENKGWAMFITTFRGRNHAWRMFETVKELDTWYADIKTIADTYRHNGEPIVSEADVQQEIREGMDPTLVQQEFYCNPDAATSGAIFTRQYARLMAIDPQPYALNNHVIRIAWGIHEEGIAALAFQGNHILNVHTFAETNIVDAAQTVIRRHPNSALIHHAIQPDPSVFGEFDGAGIVASPLTKDPHMMHGHTSAMLNVCNATSVARERLADFSMHYAPWRESIGEEEEQFELTNSALMKALAVMHTAQPLNKSAPRRPMDYSRVDRGII
jgi:hypothetical protein